MSGTPRRHGIEQEFLLVDDHGVAKRVQAKVLERLADAARGLGGVRQEHYQSQIEIATDARTSLADLKQDLVELRALVREAAAAEGARLWGVGMSAFERPEVGEFLAEHHHLEAQTPDEKARIHNFVRAFTPELYALTADSPILIGRPASAKCYRAYADPSNPTARPNPNVKEAPFLTPDEAARGTYRDLDRKKSRYFDVTPFTKPDEAGRTVKPTVEVRLLDMQPSIAYTLAHAALFDAMAARAVKLRSISEVSISANRKLAIRDGLQANFYVEGFGARRIEPFGVHYAQREGRSMMAGEAILAMLAWLEPEFEEAGSKAEHALLTRIAKRRRGYAEWQLEQLRAGRASLVRTVLELTEARPEAAFLDAAGPAPAAIAEPAQPKVDPVVARLSAAILAAKVPVVRAPTIHALVLAFDAIDRDDAAAPYVAELRKRQAPDGGVNSSKGPPATAYATACLLDALAASGHAGDAAFEASVKWLVERARTPTGWGQAWEAGAVLSALSRANVQKEEIAPAIERLASAQTLGSVWESALAIGGLARYGAAAPERVAAVRAAKKGDHWAIPDKSPVLVTSVIVLALREAGEQDAAALAWLKRNAPAAIRDEPSLYEAALVLRVLAHSSTMA